nr:hypothetical protein [Tanacetum cinerariifolium]
MQTQTSNTLHNVIMEAGSRDRPSMLAPGNYIQWKSRIKRYIDTKPNRELIHFCLTNPPYELGWKEKPILDAEGNPTNSNEKVFETYQNVKQEIRDQLNAEAEAVQIILTGIYNDIYSTVDACPNACEMWKAIERLKQAGSESRPSMLNKENYVPWSSRLLRYAKSRPNGKLIHNSILNGPYVRRMIAKPGDSERDINVNETFHEQTDNELSKRELKQIEADDQAIQTILLVLPEDIYAAVDSCETAQEIWLRPEWSRYVTIVHQTKDLHIADYTQLYDFLKYNQKEVDELKAERIAKIQDPLALMANSNNPYVFLAPHQDQSPFNQNFLQQPMTNPEDFSDPTTLLIAQKEEAGIQLQAEEYDLMTAAADLDEIEEVNANCILMANLQQVSSSGTQTDSAPVYDSDGSTE